MDFRRIVEAHLRAGWYCLTSGEKSAKEQRRQKRNSLAQHVPNSVPTQDEARRAGFSIALGCCAQFEARLTRCFQSALSNS